MTIESSDIGISNGQIKPNSEVAPHILDGFVLKSDVSGFTRLTDYQYSLGADSVDKWLKMVDRLYGAFSCVEDRFGGLELGKEGDAVIACFNDPLKALSSAVVARSELDSLDEVIGPDKQGNIKKQKLLMRIGIASGKCYVGYASGNRRIPVFCGPAVDDSYLVESFADVGGIAVDELTKSRMPNLDFSRKGLVWVPELNRFTLENDVEPKHDQPNGSSRYVAGPIEVAASEEYNSRYQPAVLFFGNLPMLKGIAKKAIEKGCTEDVTAAYDAHFKVLETAVEGNGGIVLKLYKDKVFGGFGFPNVNEKPLRSIFEMQRCLQDSWNNPVLLDLCKKYSVDPSQFLSGAIHAGRSILTGFFGVGRRNFDLLGDAVNFCARQIDSSKLETRSVSRAYRPEGVSILVTEDVLNDRESAEYVFEKDSSIIADGKTGLINRFVISGKREAESKPLIGRDAELKKLEQVIESLSSNGNSQSIDIRAHAGYGKTELTKAFIERAKLSGVNVYVGNCAEFSRTSPDAAIIDLIKSYIGIKGSSKDKTAKVLESLNPELREVLNHWLSLGLDYSAPKLSAAQLDSKRLEVLCELFNDDKKKLIILNDIHWADEDSLNKWSKLKSRFGRNTIFTANYRDEDLPEDYKKHCSSAALTLSELDEASCFSFARYAFKGADDEVCRLLARQSKGNPLFLQEIVNFLNQEGIVRNGSLVRPVEQIALPGSVDQMVIARFDKLAPEEREYLRLVSTLDDWDKNLLSRIFPNEQAIVQKLLNKRFLQFDNRLSWNHNLIKSAIYESLRFSDKRVAHKTVGDILEERHLSGLEPCLEELAYQFWRAGQGEKGIKYNHEVMTKRYAASQYKSCPGIADRIEQLNNWANLSEERKHEYVISRSMNGIALMFLFEFDKARTEFDKAAKLVEELDPKYKDSASCRVNLNYGTFLVRKGGEDELTKEKLRTAIELARKIDNATYESSALTNLAFCFKGAERIPIFQESLMLARRTDNKQSIATSLNNLANSFNACDKFDEAISAAGEAKQIAESIGSPYLSSYALFHLSNSYLKTGKSDEALEAIKKARVAAKQVDNAHNLKGILEFLCKQHLLRDEINEAMTACKEAFELGLPEDQMEELLKLREELTNRQQQNMPQ